MAFISAHVEPCFGRGSFSNFSHELQLTPKMPGVVTIKGSLTGHKKKYMIPGALFWPHLAFATYCGSRAVPCTGMCGCSRCDPDIGIFCPGEKTQGVLKTLSAYFRGGLYTTFWLFRGNVKKNWPASGLRLL